MRGAATEPKPCGGEKRVGEEDFLGLEAHDWFRFEMKGHEESATLYGDDQSDNNENERGQGRGKDDQSLSKSIEIMSPLVAKGPDARLTGT